MFILWLYQNLFWPNLVWHLTCHIIVKILESCLITVCVLWSWFLFAIVLCVCARPRVCEGERVWVFFVCLFCMPCVEWVWMFLVLLFCVIYSRTIASIANVFCWLYPTLNKVYLILSFILSYHRWPVNSPHKGSVTRNDDIIFFFIIWYNTPGNLFAQIVDRTPNLWKIQRPRFDVYGFFSGKCPFGLV